MSSRVFVSPPVLRRTANRLESARIQMQQMLTALERVKRDLPSYWSCLLYTSCRTAKAAGPGVFAVSSLIPKTGI